MLSLTLEEFVLLLALFGIYITMRGASLVDSRNFTLQLNDLARLILLFRLKLFNALLKICLAMLRLQLLAHRKRHRTNIFKN